MENFFKIKNNNCWVSFNSTKPTTSINDSLIFEGFNWHNAIGYADIRDMHINKNGDIELYIADVYDFNVGEKNKFVRIGYDRQEKGEITPYFYAYRVIIPQEELR